MKILLILLFPVYLQAQIGEGIINEFKFNFPVETYSQGELMIFRAEIARLKLDPDIRGNNLKFLQLAESFVRKTLDDRNINNPLWLNLWHEK